MTKKIFLKKKKKKIKMRILELIHSKACHCKNPEEVGKVEMLVENKIITQEIVLNSRFKLSH